MVCPVAWYKSRSCMNTLQALFLRAKHWQLFLLLVVTGAAGLVWSVFLIALAMLCFAAWLWSMGRFLSSMRPQSLRLKTGFFRFALIYPVLYTCASAPFFPNPPMFAVFLLLQVLAMACLIYVMYFVSKNLAMVETGKPARFYDYAGRFFLLWCYPIGIWFIQPRINRLYALTGEMGQVRKVTA